MALAKESLDAIIQRVSEGETLRSVCRDLGLVRSEVYRLMDSDQAFSDRYARAREMQAESMQDNLLAMAEESPKDMVEAAAMRLRIDLGKWVMARNHPKRFGERIEQHITVGQTSQMAGLTLEEKISRLKMVMAEAPAALPAPSDSIPIEVDTVPEVPQANEQPAA